MSKSPDPGAEGRGGAIAAASFPPSGDQRLLQSYLAALVQLADTTPKPAALAPRIAPSALPAPAPAPLPPGAELAYPSIPWDWPVSPTGQTPYKLLKFADAIPDNVSSGSFYQPSAERFSSAYATLLAALSKSDYPDSEGLRTARAALVEPSIPPSQPASPTGWTRTVRSDGMLIWSLSWSASDTPQSWQASVAGQQSPRTVTLPLVNDPSGYQSVLIHADAWGQISLTPGAWLDGSILSLAKAYVKRPAAFFGKHGALRGRVATMIVALNQRFEFKKPPGLETTPPAQVFGQDVSVHAKSDDSITLASRASTPMIVAVVVERFQ